MFKNSLVGQRISKCEDGSLNLSKSDIRKSSHLTLGLVSIVMVPYGNTGISKAAFWSEMRFLSMEETLLHMYRRRTLEAVVLAVIHTALLLHLSQCCVPGPTEQRARKLLERGEIQKHKPSKPKEKSRSEREFNR